jgi:DNA-binding NarL/FixJ family response regulator
MPELERLHLQINDQRARIRELEQRKDKPPRHHHDSLSPQELRVLVYIAQGYSYGQMARRMGLAECTTRHHGGRILKKLGVRSMVQAARYAWRTGLVPLDEAWDTVKRLQWRKIQRGK